MNAPRESQRGLSLVEVMITVVIVSVGLLGLAGLQATGLRAIQDAYLRSQATFLSSDIADRMRANRDAARNGDYDVALAAAAPSGSSRSQVDLQEWKAAVAAALPLGRCAVTRSGTRFSITLQWTEGNGQVLQVVSATEL